MEFAIKEKNLFKPDILVLDQTKGFGMIELKYRNENTENLSDHYKKFSNAANSSNAEQLADELKRRCQYLLDYERINPELYENCEKSKLWYGFLFVGGEKPKSIQLAKEMADAHPKIKEDENCRFGWFPEDDLDNLVLRFDSMHTYPKFTQ